MSRDRKGYVDSYTLDADWEMDRVVLAGVRMFSTQVHINNTNLVGTLTLEVSNDSVNWISSPWQKQDPSDSTSSILVSSEDVATGVDTDLIIQADSVSTGYFRFKFSWTSGSGVIDVNSKLMRGI